MNSENQKKSSSGKINEQNAQKASSYPYPYFYPYPYCSQPVVEEKNNSDEYVYVKNASTQTGEQNEFRGCAKIVVQKKCQSYEINKQELFLIFEGFGKNPKILKRKINIQTANQNLFLAGVYKFLQTKLTYQVKNQKDMISLIWAKMNLPASQMDVLIENGKINDLKMMKKFSEKQFFFSYQKMLKTLENDLNEENKEKYELFFQNLQKLVSERNLEGIKTAKQLWEIMPMSGKTIEDIVMFASKLTAKLCNELQIEEID